MRNRFRAAGIAAAVTASAATFFFAAPGRALESPTAPAASPLLFHASASLDAADLAVNPDPALAAGTEADGALAADARPDVAAEEEDSDRSLGELVADYASSSPADAEQACLATAVYYESKGEPLEGQLNVAEVVLNRKHSSRFPDSVCAVVTQPGQFSFVRRGHLPSAPRHSAAWRKAVAVAHVARAKLARGSARKALFFHARRVKPGWHGLTQVSAVGNHIFYR